MKYDLEQFKDLYNTNNDKEQKILDSLKLNVRLWRYNDKTYI